MAGVGRAEHEVTVGVDLASQPKGTGLVVVEWSSHGGEVASARVGATDADVLEAAVGADGVGIDSPFGWPVAFTEATGRWAAGERFDEPDAGSVPVGSLTHRATDRHARAVTGRLPLSASADRLAYVAFRCAHLLDELGRRRGLDRPVDRTGGDGVHEVWPYGSLLVWGGWVAGYNKRGAAGEEIRWRLLRWLTDEVPLAVTDELAVVLVAEPDAFDALLCALASRAVTAGLAGTVPAEQADAAAIEGWILLPEPGSLASLVGQVSS